MSPSLVRTDRACTCGSTTSCVLVSIPVAASEALTFKLAEVTAVICQGCITKALVPRTFARSRFDDERPES